MKVSEFVKRIQDEYLPNRSDALELAAFVADVEYADLPSHMDDQVEIDDYVKGLLDRIKDGEPLAYVVSNKSFYGYDFMVNESVLIPRPETEILVEQALKYVEKRKDEPLKILDICTGSGCILTTLLKELPNATGVGVDICKDALDIAGENLRNHDVRPKAGLIKMDSLRLEEYSLGKFDIITCNPPYLSENEWELSPKSLKYEPKKALSAGSDPFLFYKKLMDMTPELCNKNGVVLFEVGLGQSQLLNKTEGGYEYHAVKDYQHIERVLIWTNLS
jgi:release factor glutamine methyltransferase